MASNPNLPNTSKRPPKSEEIGADQCTSDSDSDSLPEHSAGKRLKKDDSMVNYISKMDGLDKNGTSSSGNKQHQTPKCFGDDSEKSSDCEIDVKRFTGSEHSPLQRESEGNSSSLSKNLRGSSSARSDSDCEIKNAGASSNTKQSEIKNIAGSSSVRSTSDSDGDTKDPAGSSSTRLSSERDIKSSSEQSENESIDLDHVESSSVTESEQSVFATGESERNLNPSSKDSSSSSNRMQSSPSAPSSDSNSDADSDGEDGDLEPKEDDETRFNPFPKTPLPKHKWNHCQAVLNRQYGFSSKYSPDLFRYDCYGSLHMVQRLELMYKMNNHDGCVNALNFNASGTKLVSGSDDKHVIVWNWTISEALANYISGHTSNVFQAKFMPLSNDTVVVTCARDGQIRLGELSSDGTCKGTRKLAQHKGPAHRLSLSMDSPHYFYTCGEDSAVFGIDLRQEKQNRLVMCKHGTKKVSLYSIFTNPCKSYEFAVAGTSQYAKVYDTRFLSQSDKVLNEYCPDHLNFKKNIHITCLVYNYNGSEILASYNDEDIYMFDTSDTSTYNYLHRYKGHRNSRTVKGVNYFGPKSEYVMSGSDCGYIFFWDKESEHIVKYMYGDEGGSVNCLEPNPTMPVLASSGLDDDIKIWVPSCEDAPDLSSLKTHVIRNMKQREQEVTREYSGGFVEQALWFLMQNFSRHGRSRDSDDDDEEDNDTSSNSSEDGNPGASQCIQS